MKMCPRRHWLYFRLTFCIPTFLSQLIKIAEFLIKSNGSYARIRKTFCSTDVTDLLFEEYLQENTSFYILKPGLEIGQSLKKTVYEEVSFLLRTNISHE